jgi:serine/threonine-protein kinase
VDVGCAVAGRYHLEALLGQGAFGQVFRARDELLGRRVALKLLRPGRASRKGDQERFLQEARTIAKLEHPHIVPVHDAGILDGRPWMAMRLVEGRSLAALLIESGGLSPAHALQCLIQVASALEHAHRRGIVHRDVKPSNLIVERVDEGREHFWLADFGIARVLTTESTGDHTVAGTPSYMAPEQITGRRIDPRADLFAVGCVGCELLTGLRTFEGETFTEILHKVVHEPARGLDQVETLAGPGVAACLARALAKSPEDRHASATELLSELQALARGDIDRPNASWRTRIWRRVKPPVSWDGRHVLVVERLGKSYRRGRPVLHDLSLSVPKGAIYALLGSNGAGKTTLLRTVLGLYRPDSGLLRVFGRDPQRERTAVLARIGYVPEVVAAYPGMRVGEVLDFVGRCFGTWDNAYCHHLLGRFDLPLSARLRTLSRGLQTKVALVSALAQRPEFLVLDDPTLGLDAVVLAEFFDVLRDASRREGTTVLMASHHLEELDHLASHVAFLKAGSVLRAGPLPELKAQIRGVELTFRGEMPDLARLPSFRRIPSTGRPVSGLLLDSSDATLRRLRELGAEKVTVREPSLKEVFVGLMGDPATTGARASP